MADFILEVTNTPEPVVTDKVCNFVEVKQDLTGGLQPTSFYVLDNGVITLVQAGGSYRWESGEPFQVGATVGEIWVAAPITKPLAFDFTESLGWGQGTSSVAGPSIYVSNFEVSAAGGVTAGATTTASGSLVLCAGSNITLSQSTGTSASSITIVGPAPSAASIYVSATSAVGGSVAGGTSAQFTTLQLVAGNEISLSQSSATLTIAGPSFSAGPNIGITTGSVISISASASGAAVNALGAGTSTSAGSLSVSGGNNITVSSSGASVIGISAPANIVNAVGAGTSTSAGSISFSAGPNITISSSGASVIGISGAAGGGAAGTQTISASGTSITGTAISLALVAGANISLQTATAAGAMTISISGENAISVPGGSSTGTVTFSAGPNITISSSGASIIGISGPNAGGAGLSGFEMSGNTSGTSSLITTGTVILQAVSPIGLSQSTTTGANSTTSNILSVFGPAYSAASPLAVSTTGGTISMAGPAYSAGGILSVSTTGGTISYAATTPAVMSAAEMSGNTSGTSSIISTGTLILQAVSPIVLSQSTTTGANSTTSNVLSILAPAFSAGGGLGLTTTGGTISYSQTLQGNIVSSIGAAGSLSSGPITVSGVNLTVSSNGAGVIQLSVSAQTVQPGISAVEMSGNTSGTSSVISNGTVFLQAISPIGLSQSTTTGANSTTSSILSIFGPSYSAASPLALSTTGGTISIAGPAYSAGGIVSVSTTGGTISYSASTPLVQSVVQISGNTSGTSSAITSGTLFLQAISPIVLSQSTTTGANSTTSNVVSVLGPVYSAGGGLGLTTTGGTISYSQTVQGNIVSSIGPSGSLSSGPITVSGVNITVSSNGAGVLQLSAAAQTVQPAISAIQISGNTSGTSSVITNGTVFLQAVSPIGLSQSTTTGANSTTSSVLSVFGPNYSAGGGLGVTTTGGTVSFATTGSFVNALVPAGNTSGAAQTFTGSVTLSAASPLLLSQTNTNQTLTISGPSYSAGTGLAVSTTGGTISYATTGNVVNSFEVSASGGGTTSGATTTVSGGLILCAGSNITLSQTTGTSANSITIIGPSPSGGGGNIVQGSNLATSTGTIVISGTNNITISTGASSIQISGPTLGTLSFISGTGISFSSTTAANATSITIQTSGSVVSSIGPSGSLSSGPITVTGAAGINISSNGAGIILVSQSLLASKVTLTQNYSFNEIAGPVVSGTASSATTLFGSSLFLQRIFIPASMNLTEVDLAHNIAFAATNAGQGQLLQSFGVYSFSGGTNSSALVSVFSASSSWQWTSSTATTAGSGASLTQYQGGWSGNLIHSMGLSSGSGGVSTLSAGEYVVGNLLALSASSTTLSASLFGPLIASSSTTAASAVTAITSATLGAMSSGGLAAASALTASTSTAVTAFTAAPSIASVLSSGGLSSASALSGISSYGSAFVALSWASANSASGLTGFTLAPGTSSGTIASGITAAAVSLSGTGTAKSSASAWSLIGSTSNSNIVSSLGVVTGSHFTASTSVSVLSNAGTAAVNLLSSGGLSAGSFFTASGSLSAVTAVGAAALLSATYTGLAGGQPTFSIQNTGSSFTSASSPYFVAGIMSTGALPAAITLTSTAVTMSGSTAFQQPWFAICGS